MDLMKYVIAGGISLVIGIIAVFMGNLLSGILIFVLLFGGYVMWNVVKSIKDEPKDVTLTPPSNTPQKDN